MSLSDFAKTQLRKLTKQQIHALDRAFRVIAAHPERGQPTPDGRLRNYRDDIGSVRVIYSVTTSGATVVVVYVEA
ncbi:type II toxin-antitoxin system RelE/ParE family toxin (plasmid) [Kitasatospora sp. NBC_00070]|uniref:type II toxin-antitoxin system RelE/ParE family toxin n=1 Tax=Kitasatospora sp. NBC_00070 TaxID=2975962 RepID=UPI002F916AC7